MSLYCTRLLLLNDDLIFSQKDLHFYSFFKTSPLVPEGIIALDISVFEDPSMAIKTSHMIIITKYFKNSCYILRILLKLLWKRIRLDHEISDFRKKTKCKGPKVKWLLLFWKCHRRKKSNFEEYQYTSTNSFLKHTDYSLRG